MAEKELIPIFFACDDNFVRFTIVSITSLKANASRNFHYNIHILYTEMSREMKDVALALADDDFSIFFDDVSHFLKAVNYRLHVRDYYSKTTYYRLFIPDLYPEYKKALYLDSDIAILGDISELYLHDLGEYYMAACQDKLVIQTPVFCDYVEKVLGIDRNHYFNAGVILINCEIFRQVRFLDQFLKKLHEYVFSVAQDQDYLNVLCKDKILWLDGRWNAEMCAQQPGEPGSNKILHYNMWSKPWHFKECPGSDEFWKYADQTTVASDIHTILDAYTEQQKEKDLAAGEKLTELAVSETNRPDNYLNRQTMIRSFVRYIQAFRLSPDVKQSEEKLRLLKKIDEYEINGRFDQDIEDLPIGHVLKPQEVNFERKGLLAQFKAYTALKNARQYRRNLVLKRDLIIRDINGIENLKELNGGCLITCNHFNILDSFALEYVWDEMKKLGKKGRFYRVIREEYFTGMGGFLGSILRNANTLPISQNHQVMNEFLHASIHLLHQGNYILVYPEHGMWWNYRKPRPMKKGFFSLAARTDVPVLPVFITMEDTKRFDDDGFPIQAYTINIGKLIYPKEGVHRHENVEYLMEENYKVWKKMYEDAYKIPLSYLTE